MRYESDTRKCDQCGVECTLQRNTFGGARFHAWVAIERGSPEIPSELQRLDFCGGACATKYMLKGVRCGAVIDEALYHVYAYVAANGAKSGERTDELRRLAARINELDRLATGPT